MKILIVEDEARIAAAIKKGLELELHVVDHAADGEAGYDLASEGAYDLVILDLMLPKLDGLTLCRKLRQMREAVPILMLTAKDLVSDKVTGLDAGADDYLAKPFDFAELVARVRALTRRPRPLPPSQLTVGNLHLDPINFQVSRADLPIHLTRKEFSLLEFLVRNTGQVLSKSKIITHVWEYEANILENTVEVYIRSLRHKLGDPGLIHTVRGFGYRLAA